ncbi:MAG: class I SAM-dependent methyltransferase [Desulfobacterales bacterium]|nr:class I SAM-dependent methyltransferase [Desulfobacterales bacterium]
MKKNKASVTAEYMAIHRAAEARLPEGERVCYDPFARYFLSSKIIYRHKSPIRRKIARWIMHNIYPGLNGAIVARVRFIDDYLLTCIDDNLEQLVILGAGYDTRAYRIDGLKEKVRVFEIDHPATQELKMEKLKAIFPSLPSHVVYVPINFDNEQLDKKLLEAGYDKIKKTLFILEGLTMYMPPEAIDETLSFITENSGDYSSVVFDCLPSSIVDGTIKAKEGKTMRRHVIRRGEPFRFGLEKEEIEDFLSKRGFFNIKKVMADECRDIYFKGASRDRKISGIFAFVHATVRPD